MIRLEIEEYCQWCMDFTPDVTKPQRVLSTSNEEVFQTDTIVQCEHKKRCAGIKRYLENQLKNEEAAG